MEYYIRKQLFLVLKPTLERFHFSEFSAMAMSGKFWNANSHVLRISKFEKTSLKGAKKADLVLRGDSDPTDIVKIQLSTSLLIR